LEVIQKRLDLVVSYHDAAYNSSYEKTQKLLDDSSLKRRRANEFRLELRGYLEGEGEMSSMAAKALLAQAHDLSAAAHTKESEAFEQTELTRLSKSAKLCFSFAADKLGGINFDPTTLVGSCKSCSSGCFIGNMLRCSVNHIFCGDCSFNAIFNVQSLLPSAGGRHEFSCQYGTVKEPCCIKFDDVAGVSSVDGRSILKLTELVESVNTKKLLTQSMTELAVTKVLDAILYSDCETTGCNFRNQPSTPSGCQAASCPGCKKAICGNCRRLAPLVEDKEDDDLVSHLVCRFCCFRLQTDCSLIQTLSEDGADDVAAVREANAVAETWKLKQLAVMSAFRALNVLGTLSEAEEKKVRADPTIAECHTKYCIPMDFSQPFLLPFPVPAHVAHLLSRAKAGTLLHSLPNPSFENLKEANDNESDAWSLDTLGCDIFDNNILYVNLESLGLALGLYGHADFEPACRLATELRQLAADYTEAKKTTIFFRVNQGVFPLTFLAEAQTKQRIANIDFVTGAGRTVQAIKTAFAALSRSNMRACEDALVDFGVQRDVVRLFQPTEVE